MKTTSLSATQGRLIFGAQSIQCCLGRSGITHHKKEGDGASPFGSYKILGGYFRADRIARPTTQIGLKPIGAHDGWCDDPKSANYNRPIQLPFPTSHEEMYRADRLYDIVLVLDQNIDPRQPGSGSAIFFHLSSTSRSPTAGCIAIDYFDMLRVLSQASAHAQLHIG